MGPARGHRFAAVAHARLDRHSRVIAAAGDEVAAVDDGSVGLAGRIRQGLRRVVVP